LAALLAYAGLAFAAVNINTATQKELESLDGIGPVKAKAIVDYRAKNGPFKSLDDVKKVGGIKDATFDKMKGDIAITGATTPIAKPDARAESKVMQAKEKEKASDAKAIGKEKATEAKATGKEKATESKAKAKEEKTESKAKAKEGKTESKAKAKEGKAEAKAKAKAAAKDAKADEKDTGKK
jgi:competence protein ComEA